ncbi:MAG: dihydroorotase [Saprospiraceae bacterium]|nr:dihydroorotase [Saprospiraceae bacterium]
MATILIKNGQLVNRGKIFTADVFIRNGRIEQIAGQIDRPADTEINAEGKFVLPGIIDDQVHFREPGLTHKAEIYTESRAAVAGGVTSFMEMPNTKPPAVTQDLLEQKYQRAAQVSLANYSFFMGTTNDNADEALRTDLEKVCGIKIFMGSSTGKMLVDDERALRKLFGESDLLIATHCEDETRIEERLAMYQAKYGDDIPFQCHPEIRDAEVCRLSSSHAIDLAKELGTRLHILHISTAVETDLFENKTPLEEKRITSEVCVHHLFFNDSWYAEKGSLIKCNPAIKSASDQEALWAALSDDRFDVIATDHAPHTWEEKQGNYMQAPSGLPLVQHSLNLMMHFHQQGRISIERIVEKMCHNPARIFRMQERGYLDEGMWADVVIFDPNPEWEVNRAGLYYKCGWSPLEDFGFKGRVDSTIVSGHLAFHQGELREGKSGERLLFRGFKR